MVISNSLLTILLGLASTSLALTQNSPELVLTDENWDLMLEGEWMVKFYAPWCPACRALETTWTAFAGWSVNEDKQIKIASVDVTEQPALNGRFMITALPTIYHVKNGEFRQYRSSRSLEDLKDFVDNQEWQDISPVSSWTSPSSAIMSFMSSLFSFSMKIKDYHFSLNTQYGFPTWLSMLLFGLLIIAVGLLLGIALVFVTDYIWAAPPSAHTGQVIANENASNKSTEHEDLSESKSETIPNDKEDETIENEAMTNIRQRNVKKDTAEDK